MYQSLVTHTVTRDFMPAFSSCRQSGKGRLIWALKWKIIYFFSLSDLKEKRERRELLSGYYLEEPQAEQERGHYASSVKKYIR